MGKRSRERERARQHSHGDRQRAQPGSAGGRTGRVRQHQRQPDHEVFRTIANELVAAALHARQHDNEAQLARCLTALADAPSADMGRRIVNRALATWFDNVVEATWKRGWQPADLARVAGRETGPRQARMVVDAMAHQMRRYAAATVDERWEAQLNVLGADVWWQDDDAWLDEWGAREGRDRLGVLHDALDVLLALDTLPGLPTLCPPPGTARRGSLDPRRAPGSTIDARILDRVRGLLAKAESTEFAKEADAFTAKAQELMARHSIDYALLAAKSGSQDKPGGLRVGIDNPYEASKALLLDKVAGANRCRTVWTKSFGFSAVIGYESDLAAVELLYTSLLVQATTAMMREGSRQDRYGRSTTRSFRQSFLTAFAVRIGERLMAATHAAGEQAVAEAGRDRLLPVLAARDKSVDDATTEMYPEMVSTPVKAGNLEGMASGRAAADLASLDARQQVGRSKPR